MQSSAEDHVLHLLEAIADEVIHPIFQAESYKLILIEEARLNQRISDLHEKFEELPSLLAYKLTSLRAFCPSDLSNPRRSNAYWLTSLLAYVL